MDGWFGQTVKLMKICLSVIIAECINLLVLRACVPLITQTSYNSFDLIVSWNSLNAIVLIIEIHPSFVQKK